MNKQTIMTTALSLCILLSTGTQAKSNDNTDVPTISVTKIDLSNKVLNLSYEIRNNSKQDIWICDSVSPGYNFEVFPHDDGQTLIVRKRLDIPCTTFWHVQPFGKYICLHRGEKRVESLLLSVPVSCVYQYEPEPRKRSGHVIDAKRLSIEIGYYVGDLPEFFSEIIKETEKTDIDKSILLKVWFGGLVGFNDRNEVLGQRDEEILIPYTDQMLRGEQALRIIKDDLRIPYKETNERQQYNPPELTTCTRIEIQYEPSMLEYFYPHQNQQNFLNMEEIEYIGYEKVTIIEDINDINGLANELKQTKQMVGGIVSEKSKANVIGYHDSRRVISFIVYDDTTIDTEKKQRIKYNAKLKSVRKFTPQIQPFELRMNCAANMKNLWYRLRFYSRAENKRIHSLRNFTLSDADRFNDPKKTRDVKLDLGKVHEDLIRETESFYESRRKDEKDLYSNINLIYPAPLRWCDAMEWAFAVSAKGKWHDSKMKAHVCPGVSERRSTYAMNPNCKYDSPLDMVLLFETKAGWNQHGGPELFTFDNHDPKGGCVLLNDGTVKFIRTKEELKQLRWK